MVDSIAHRSVFRLGFFVILAALTSCANTPVQVVHVPTPPGLVSLLKHPTVRLSDRLQGNWVRGVPIGAGESWSSPGWKDAFGGAAGSEQAAPFALVAVLASYLVGNTIHNLAAPSTERVRAARASIDRAVNNQSWRSSFERAFIQEARTHGITDIQFLAPKGPNSDAEAATVEVTIAEARVGTRSPHPVIKLEWGVHRPGASLSAWWGWFEIECADRQSFLSWGADDGERLSNALNTMFREAGKKLAKELYEGTDVKL